MTVQAETPPRTLFNTTILTITPKEIIPSWIPGLQHRIHKYYVELNKDADIRLFFNQQNGSFM